MMELEGVGMIIVPHWPAVLTSGLMLAAVSALVTQTQTKAGERTFGGCAGRTLSLAWQRMGRIWTWTGETWKVVSEGFSEIRRTRTNIQIPNYKVHLKLTQCY